MAVIPQWFTTEVAQRLTDVRQPDKTSPQHYARCPVARHVDRHRSFAFRPGDEIPLVYHCHVDCTDAEVREALEALGIPVEYLGRFGTPEYEARRQGRSAIQQWREVEKLRYAMADLRNDIRGLIVADLSLALLKVRLLSVVDDVDIPTVEKEYVAFAQRAGVSRPAAYKAWKVDPICQGLTPCVSEDHVVLTQPSEERQVSQVTGCGGNLDSRQSVSVRDEEKSRFETMAAQANDKNRRPAA